MRRAPDEIFLRMLADDGNHPAHDGDAHVGVVALAHLDQLRRGAAHVLVPAVEQERGIVVTHALDLEDAAALLGVVIGGGAGCRSGQVGRQVGVPFCLLTVDRRLLRRSTLAAPGLDVRPEIAFYGLRGLRRRRRGRGGWWW